MNFNQELFEKLKQSEISGFLESIHEPVFKPSDMPITYRIINHWHENDLFLYKMKPGEWRKFSVADYIWVLFLNKLRILNVGLATIKSVREQSVASIYGYMQMELLHEVETSTTGILSKESSKFAKVLSDPEQKKEFEEMITAKEFQMFSLWLNMGILGNKDVLFRVLPDEKHTLNFIQIDNRTDKDKLLNSIIEKGGVFISLQSLLNEFFGERRFKWEEVISNKLSEVEKKIIGILREKNCKTVTVHFKQGEMNHVKLEEQNKVMPIGEFNAAMLSGRFTNTELITQDGNTFLVKTTRTIKLK